jgi:hypothetical protein
MQDLIRRERIAGTIDRPTPHGSLNDRSEVVVHENNIKSFLSSLSAGNTENPTSAVLRAGPSFVPSPATPTISPREGKTEPRPENGNGLDAFVQVENVVARGWGMTGG